MEKDLDMKLYNEYLKGEKGAFEMLYNKYKDKIQYFVYNIVKDYQKAEDITQETFLYILQNSIKGEYSFKYTIYLIAKSKAINCIKSENKRTEIAEQYLSKEENQAEKDLLDIVSKIETKKEIIEAIDMLDDKYRTAIYLTKIEELSYKETANILNESEQNIKNIVHRGKKRLRIILIKKGFDNMSKISKVSVIILCTTILLTGIVFAGTKIYEVYEKVWKEPESYTYDEMINQIPGEITEEEKEELITEDEAKEIGLEMLRKLGYENQTINRIELKRGYAEDVPSYYMVKTKWGYEEGLMVQLNANGGDFIAFDDMDLKYKHLPTEKLLDEEISKIAKDFYQKIGLDENLYKLAETRVNDYYFQNQASDLLSASFYKYYNGIANKYESFNVSFISVNGEIMLNSILINIDNSFQNNEVVISKDEALNIANNKEKEFSHYDITNTDVELSIEKMNTFIYRIENNTFNQTEEMEDKTYYKTDNITRNVWKVKIEHGLTMKDFGADIARRNEYYKEGMSKYYFIDATTGEIIGGNNVNMF